MRLAFIPESSRLRRTHAEYFELLKIEISKVQAVSAPRGTLAQNRRGEYPCPPRQFVSPEVETGSIPGRGMKRQCLDTVIVLEFSLASEDPNVAR